MVLAKHGLGQTWSWPNLVWPNFEPNLAKLRNQTWPNLDLAKLGLARDFHHHNVGERIVKVQYRTVVGSGISDVDVDVGIVLITRKRQCVARLEDLKTSQKM